MNIVQTFRRLGQQMKGWSVALRLQNEQLPLIQKLYNKHGLLIKLTCGACPEQYEIYKYGEKVAYYRLRHGEFTVTCPDESGEEIFSAEPDGDGIFNTMERLLYLNKAMHKVLEWVKRVDYRPNC